MFFRLFFFQPRSTRVNRGQPRSTEVNRGQPRSTEVTVSQLHVFSAIFFIFFFLLNENLHNVELSLRLPLQRVNVVISSYYTVTVVILQICFEFFQIGRALLPLPWRRVCPSNWIACLNWCTLEM